MSIITRFCWYLIISEVHGFSYYYLPQPLHNFILLYLGQIWSATQNCSKFSISTDFRVIQQNIKSLLGQTL